MIIILIHVYVRVYLYIQYYNDEFVHYTGAGIDAVKYLDIQPKLDIRGVTDTLQEHTYLIGHDSYTCSTRDIY